MITNALGPSLEDIFDKCDRLFDMQLVLEFASQFIFRLEWMHSHNISHGNLTHASFTMGYSPWQAPQVILADFGSIDMDENLARKDMEAVADILVYLSTGSPSWEHFQAHKPKFPIFHLPSKDSF
ncbi:uncharacterized protein N7487_008634 [Penicillium crustosum]|nr:uncharacterized protein N7487_008634 [Penicillium crustosum]KAJ5402738.1 hypothetical protein N7487_008634 [Penicillium crustosum]